MKQETTQKTEHTHATTVITKDMTIGDVVKQHPHLAEILLANGVHCVGCGARYFETLEMGFKGHGMTDEKVDSIVQQMNDAIKNNPASESEDVQLTELAAQKLKEILQRENKADYALRVKVMKGGCAGYSYGLNVDKDVNADDKVIEAFGVKLIVDAESLPLVKGAKIDYVDALQNAGFRISNPNAKRSCGCGQSFH